MVFFLAFVQLVRECSFSFACCCFYISIVVNPPKHRWGEKHHLTKLIELCFGGKPYIYILSGQRVVRRACYRDIEKEK